MCGTRSIPAWRAAARRLRHNKPAEEALSSVSFFNLYHHAFARVAVCLPEVRVADPAHNATSTIALLGEAARRKAILALFPELGLSGYTCEDLFHQQALLDGALAALEKVVASTRDIPVIAVLGAPRVIDQR